jgi:multisubunit Na+/H+ antiporter MnhC subunit
MIAMYLATVEFVRALRRALRDPASRALILTTAVVIGLGTVFYTLHEDWSPLDALYFTMMTLMTIGYGDLVPTTALSKVFTVLYAMIGIGLVASTVAVLAVAATERAHDRAERRVGGRRHLPSLPMMATETAPSRADEEPDASDDRSPGSQ